MTGEWIIKPQFIEAGAFENGRAKVLVSASKKSTKKLPKEKTIDRQGKFVER